MKIKNIVLDENSLGVTQRSLKVLRDTLSRCIDQHIALVEVPTNDLCCGYLILNRDTGVATFTGDGFRTDGGGEGGAGYRSAQALIRLFGLRPYLNWYDEPVDLSGAYSTGIEIAKKRLLKVAQELEEVLEAGRRFVRPLDKMPDYLR